MMSDYQNNSKQNGFHLPNAASNASLVLAKHSRQIFDEYSIVEQNISCAHWHTFVLALLFVNLNWLNPGGFTIIMQNQGVNKAATTAVPEIRD